MIWAGAVIFLQKDDGPDFTGKTEEEIKAYFYSEEYQNLSLAEQIAIKKKAYAPYAEQNRMDIIEEGKAYSKLSPRQKVAYIDKMIDEYVAGAAKKKAYAKKTGAGVKQGAATGGLGGKSGSGGKSGGSGQSGAKNWDSAENFRNWSESMDPVERAYIMELKEAFMERAEQRGIEL